ncbi:hypothetical protein Z948_397 [Sulfitobacter donghicola DSW-25 = KCTC 12864 = JCM 14565]|uniref:Uncharacterized protein n=1 Tax=Sulfitobacter donghicola DSW-25 = KCTC 12864 = JCM 14565 TaxID=1300350 RepID=A0A073IKN9_9RHOB|nr:hypothetical protein DSW25_08085 [Sulfitobacter donghicola DSW-25 = KCTC 12864 = JCM 14565]KIN66696.1 hypothetical protein Z948_397 [Sulfitobacter donghicola DSW-25 = KCTC 12864 = JCM 14565]
MAHDCVIVGSSFGGATAAARMANWMEPLPVCQKREMRNNSKGSARFLSVNPLAPMPNAQG